ncbi:MAG: IS21 family transposase, partial [Culicoidibacterales bacterium]
LALKQATPWLKKTFENYYSTNPRGFVDLLTIIQKYSLQEVSYAIEENTRNNLPVENSYIIDTILKKYDATIKIQATELAIEHTCHTQLSDISNLYNQGACKWKN